MHNSFQFRRLLFGVKVGLWPFSKESQRTEDTAQVCIHFPGKIGQSEGIGIWFKVIRPNLGGCTSSSY